MKLLVTIYIVCLGGRIVEITKIEAMIKKLLGKQVSSYITFNSDIASDTETRIIEQKINTNQPIAWQSINKIEIFQRSLYQSENINLLRLSELPNRIRNINTEETNLSKTEYAFAELILTGNIICINESIVRPEEIILPSANSQEIRCASSVSKLNLTNETLNYDVWHEGRSITSFQSGLPPSLQILASIILNFEFDVRYFFQEMPGLNKTTLTPITIHGGRSIGTTEQITDYINTCNLSNEEAAKAVELAESLLKNVESLVNLLDKAIDDE